ncbi:polysaccharide deacetylase family protein [Vagococcus salmoninarum]|uniref:polysaccharide deacetylase family protein n=1 Tax=Vagococcus salmoninarum TaxID=2739 RepID=UPI00188225CC|nr:polysaccharide deacetylase family protein [Vagococcus salmoninarum]MBE9389899.1 polysaccharide deacetylase family protein [Vagococcus salmoninarum]
MTKQGKIILGSLGCLALLIYGFYFIKNQQKLKIEIFETAEKNMITTIENQSSPKNNQLIKTKKHQTEIFIYLPENSQKEPYLEIKADLEKIAAELEKETSQEAVTKIVLDTQEQPLKDSLSTYVYTQKVYQWVPRKETWQETTKTLPNKVLINKLTNKKLTLGDVFTSQQHLLMINRHIQEEHLANSDQSPEAIDKILNFPQFLATETNFTFYEDHVLVHLPNQPDYPLNYLEYSQYVNPDLIAEEFVTTSEEPLFVTKNKQIALTFDDGPGEKTTPELLRLLKKHQVPATFFMLGQQVEKFPNIVKQISEEGHELANHSYNHPDLTTLNREEVRQQINQTQSAIYQASGVLPKYVRPPYGSFNYETAISIGLPIINWSVDSLDWKSKDEKKIVEEIIKTTEANSIILTHDIHQETIDSMDKVITDLKKDGYEFVTISELLQNPAKPLSVHYAANDQRPINPKK